MLGSTLTEDGFNWSAQLTLILCIRPFLTDLTHLPLFSIYTRNSEIFLKLILNSVKVEIMCQMCQMCQVVQSAHFSKIAVLKNKTLPSKIASSIMFPKFPKGNRQPVRKQAARLNGKYCWVMQIIMKYHSF